MSEQIAFSDETSEFYISVKDLNGKEVSQKPLSAWHFSKTETATIIIRREMPNYTNLEEPIRVELFAVNLTYRVSDKAKEVYLRKEVFPQENGSLIAKVFMKNVDLGHCQEVPLPSKLFVAEDFPEFTVKKSKGKLITKAEAISLLKSGQCMGIYSEDLSKRMII